MAGISSQKRKKCLPFSRVLPLFIPLQANLSKLAETYHENRKGELDKDLDMRTSASFEQFLSLFADLGS